MPRTALYPGSFDPFTNGHLDVLRGSLALCDRLVIGVGVHPSKAPLIPPDVRLELIEAVARPLASAAGAAVEAKAFDGLVIDFAGEVGATILVRGVRDGTDLDYEMHMAGMNASMAPRLLTVFLPASPVSRHITATLVRQIASLGGDIAPFVPPVVAAYLNDRRGT